MDSPAKPKARVSGLIERTMDGELIVYDLERHRAAALNPIAAAVWRACDGERDAAALGRILGESGTPIDEAGVWRTLKMLGREQLLEEAVVPPAAFRGSSRRAFVRSAATAALVAVPVITAISVPTPAQAASCIAGGAPCDLNNPGACCSSVCVINGGNPVCQEPCVPSGGPCSLNNPGACCSSTCVVNGGNPICA